MKAATAVALTNGRAHQEWQKKLKICRRAPGFGVILLLIFTRLRQVCKWVSLYCHLNSISRQELGEIIRGGDTETTALGKRKQKKPQKPSNHSASCFDFFYSCVSTEVEVFSELWHPSFRKRLPGLYKWLQSCENNDNCCAPQPTQWP